MSEVQTGTLIPYLAETFRYQAWISLGKVTNPVSQKVERDLPVAKQMIDLLAELETRTEGNRSDDESKLLQGVLTELRLNYLDELKRPEASGGEGESENPSTGGTESESSDEKSEEPA
jgi:hypothetical protein